MAPDFGRLDGVDKSIRVGLPYSLQGWFDIRTGDDGIDHLIRLVGVRSLDDRDGGTVMAGVMDHITDLKLYAPGDYMMIDAATRRNLELCETIRQKEKRGSLYWVLDKTKTAMGGSPPRLRQSQQSTL